MIVAGIPAYNEEKTIAKVILLAKRQADVVIVCDDGSNDLTADIAESLGVKVLRHSKNLGKGAAIKSLFKASREIGADVLVTLDADGQHDPNEIPELIGPILDNQADIVIGSRIKRRNEMPVYRQIGNRVLDFFTNAGSKNKVMDTQSGFRAYSKRAIQEINIIEMGLGVDSQILLDAEESKLRVIERVITCSYEKQTSKRNPIVHAADVLVSILTVITEKRPLLYLGVPSAILLMIGTFLTMWLLNLYVSDKGFSIVMALFAMATILIGLLLAFAAIILKAISRLRSYYL
jgi:glycosyltransferase involved in cell wall biosynthesis